LKPPEATRSRRPVNAVNRAQVQTLRPQRHLKPGYLGPCRSDPRRRSHDHAEERKHARAAPQSANRFDGGLPIPCRDGRTRFRHWDRRHRATGRGKPGRKCGYWRPVHSKRALSGESRADRRHVRRRNCSRTSSSESGW